MQCGCKDWKPPSVPLSRDFPQRLALASHLYGFREELIRQWIVTEVDGCRRKNTGVLSRDYVLHCRNNHPAAFLTAVLPISEQRFGPTRGNPYRPKKRLRDTFLSFGPLLFYSLFAALLTGTIWVFLELQNRPSCGLETACPYYLQSAGGPCPAGSFVESASECSSAAFSVGITASAAVVQCWADRVPYYLQIAGGPCPAGSFIESLSECSSAALNVTVGINADATDVSSIDNLPHGCFTQNYSGSTKLYFNSNGSPPPHPLTPVHCFKRTSANATT